MRIFFILMGVYLMQPCDAQQERMVGGPCQGCEALYEHGDTPLQSTDTIPGHFENDPKLIISGTIYEKDGKTPASGIILYIYQTNRAGVYAQDARDLTPWGNRHGQHRGWIKTGPDGTYQFMTFRPESYPNREVPEHIPMTVKEPTTNAYYLDAIQFEDDLLLTSSLKRQANNRGGSGICQPQKLPNGTLVVHRTIILGENIPNY